MADESDIWNKSYHGRVPDYFSERTEELFREAVTQGAYPTVDRPEFNTEDSYIPADFQLQFIVPEGALIRYTTDSTDPGHFSLATSSPLKSMMGRIYPCLPKAKN